MVPLRSHLARRPVGIGFPGMKLILHQLSLRLPFARSFLLVGIVSLGISMASNAEERSLVPQWLNAQTNIQTWTAEVRQVRSFKTLAQPLEERGQVWFAAPNQFRWEIGNPAKTIAVRQPDQMLVIYPRLQRAERFPLDGNQAGPWKETLVLLEAGFPRSQSELDAKFRIASETRSNDVCQVLLVPRSASARRMLPQLRIAFSRTDFTLRLTELQFADGSSLRNEFTNGVINATLPEDTFKPQLGPEIKIVEPLGRKSR
jgi:outer membrane lipoprotein-sorting protein